MAASTITGSEVLAQALRSQGVDTMFYLMGGPMLETEAACIELGIRAIDHAHEQAAAFAAHAYTRVMRRPGVCMGCRGPARPTSPHRRRHRLHRLRARWWPSAAPARACPSAWRPSRRSTSSRSSSRSPSGPSASTTPGASPTWWPARSARPPPAAPAPSTSTCPATSSARRSRRTSVHYPPALEAGPAQPGRSRRHQEAIALLAKAERPLVIAGSGVWWSDGAAALQTFVEAPGSPFYTKPISRGLIPEDHALSFLNARSTAFTEADVLLAVGTRFDWMIQFGRPPRSVINFPSTCIKRFD